MPLHFTHFIASSPPLMLITLRRYFRLFIAG